MADYSHLPFMGLPTTDDFDAPERQGLKLVPIACLDEATARFNALRKRCMSRMKGVTPPTFAITARGEYRHSWDVKGAGPNGETITRSRMLPAVWVRIEGTQPKLAGWSLAARLQRLATGERMVRNAPGVTIPERFRDSGYTCDHCGTDRLRKDCFVVVSDAGEFKQVGASCLKDFLGHNPAALLRFFSNIGTMTDDFSDYMGGGFRLPECDDTVALLQYACAAIRVFGWCSKGAAGAYNDKADADVKVPTVAYVAAALRPANDAEHRIRRQLEPTEVDVAMAAETLAWVRGWNMAQLSDYEANLSIALKHDIIDPRSRGIAVSAPSAFLRATSRIAELKLKEAQPASTSAHRGAEKERLRSIPVTVAYMRYIESDFGGSTLVKFTADNGDVLTWFASGRADYKPGDTGLLTGTVKRHTEFNNVKETQLSRCVLDTTKKKEAA